MAENEVQSGGGHSLRAAEIAASDREAVVRAMVNQESDLVGKRITAYLASQALLFAALATSWDKPGSAPLVNVICAAGVLTSAVSAALILYGNIATVRLVRWWDEHYPDDEGPGVIGLKPGRIAGLWVFVPTLSVIGWFYLWCADPQMPAKLGGTGSSSISKTPPGNGSNVTTPTTSELRAERPQRSKKLLLRHDPRGGSSLATAEGIIGKQIFPTIPPGH